MPSFEPSLVKVMYSRLPVAVTLLGAILPDAASSSGEFASGPSKTLQMSREGSVSTLSKLRMMPSPIGATITKLQLMPGTYCELSPPFVRSRDPE